MEKTTKVRYDHIDVAKGIGIILVIMSHVLSQYTLLSKIIYRFQVPLFFILSGVFAKPEDNFGVCLKKSFKRLFVPYTVFFCIGTVFTAFFSGFDSVGIKKLITIFILARPAEINVGALWFLACLFDVILLFNIFQ